MTNDQTVTQADRLLLAKIFHLRDEWATAARINNLDAPLADHEQKMVDEIARHRTAHSGEGRDFQSEVGDWMLACFGEEIAADKIERADRFIEEALELAQTIPGFTVDRARALVEYVFARPVGERGQEVGGVGVTLAALCNTYDLNIAAEWERELARVWTKVEAIRAKQAAKPTGSALPVPVSGEGRSNGAGEGLAGLEWTGDGLSLRTPYDGDVDGDGRHIVVGGNLIVNFDDSEIADKYRDRILAALSAPQGGVERLREALRDLWGIVHGCDLRLSVPMETIAKVRAALAQPEAGGE